MTWCFKKAVLLLVLVFLEIIVAMPVYADLTFGITPYLSPEEIHASFDPLVDELSTYLFEKVELYIARDYSDLSEKMQLGLVDIGAFSPFAYVEAVETASVRIFATQFIEGEPTYTGIIIARKDKGIKSFDDLKGGIFAFVDPKSASGFLYPRSMMIKHGNDPDLFFKKTIFSGSHDKVINDVLNGTVDAGATYDGALALSGKEDQMMVLFRTEPIPYDAYTLRPGISQEQFKAIQTFFLNLSPNKGALKRIREKHPDAKIRFSGWIAGNDDTYNVVRETAALSKRKNKIGIWSIDSSDYNIESQQLHVVAGEMLANYLSESRRFTIVPRHKLEQVYFKYNRSYKKLDDNTMKRFYSGLGIDLVLIGKLDGGSYGRTLFLSVDGLDTRTNTLVFHKDIRGESVEDMDTMITSVVTELQAFMPFETYVIGVNGRELTISSGSDDGLKPGMRFDIVNLGEEVREQGVLKRKRRIVGNGICRQVKSDTTVGEVTSGDSGQIDVGSRVRPLASESSAFSKQNRVYTAYIKGIRALGNGDNPKAIEAFHLALAEDQDYAMAHARLSAAYFNMGNREKGLEELKKSKERLNTLAFQERNYILAREATELNTFKEAMGYYQEILDKYPKNIAALHNMGLIYAHPAYEKRDLDKAKACFERVLAIDPQARISREALDRITGQGQDGVSVDIVVVFDTTESMDDEIQGMIRMTQGFADILAQNRIDVRLGLVTFGDNVRRTFSANQALKRLLTKDVGEFKSWLESLRARGGGDVAENSHEGMAEALRYVFRDKAKKMIILITDAPAHLGLPRTGLDTGAMARALFDAGATVFIVGPETQDYKTITASSGGKHYSITGGSDFTDIIQLIGKDIAGMF